MNHDKTTTKLNGGRITGKIAHTSLGGASDHQGQVERRNEVQRGNPTPENCRQERHNTPTEGKGGRERKEEREGRGETAVTNLYKQAGMGRS